MGTIVMNDVTHKTTKMSPGTSAGVILNPALGDTHTPYDEISDAANDRL